MRSLSFSIVLLFVSLVLNAQIDTTFEKYINLYPENTQLSIAIINNGDASYFGLKKIDNGYVYVVNKDSVFQIGSITKVFTATLLAELVMEGKVHLDDPFIQCIKEVNHPKDSTTFLQLANHTSGFPRLPLNINLLTMDMHDPYKNYSDSMLIEYLNTPSPYTRNPGEKYNYSNLGAGLLGFSLSKCMDQSYGDLLKQYIFDPLDMSVSTLDSNAVKNQRVIGLQPNGKRAKIWDMNALIAAGGIFSTTTDLVKFAESQFYEDNDAMQLTQQPTFTMSDQMRIGLGWHLISKGENTWLWHNGAVGGFTSSMVVDAKNKNAVIILSNISPFHKDMQKMDELAFSLMDGQKK